MNVLLTGATGFVGSHLIQSLKKISEIQEIRALVRPGSKSERPDPFVKTYLWNAETEEAPAAALDGIDVVFHLAGESIAGGRWTPEVRKRILDSREKGTRNLIQGLNRLPRPPVLISTSAVGYYGSRGDEILTEESTKGPGFLAEVCEIWEREAKRAKTSRTVILRFGVVIDGRGGMIAKLLPLFKSGMGGRVGNGKHWLAWIHRDDLVRLMIRAAVDPKMDGVYNAVAPEPVTNRQMTHELGKGLHRLTLLPAPAFALKLLFGEMAEETILASQRATSIKLPALGFSFHYPTFASAITHSVRKARLPPPF